MVARAASGPIAPEFRVLLVRVSRQYRPSFSDADLYDRTRGWWRVARRWTDPTDLSSPEWAFSVVKGIVMATYEIERWVDAGPAEIAEEANRKGRRAFVGLPDSGMDGRYQGAHVRPYFERGNSNPVRYVHCGPASYAKF